MNTLILYINTSSPKKNQIVLKSGKVVIKKTFKTEYNQTESLLFEIDQLFAEANKSPQNLTGIIAVIGPGPFTALRVGITIANTLAYSLAVPVVGFKTSQFDSLSNLISKGEKAILLKKQTKPLIPYYGKEPNITKPKSGR